MNLLTYFTEVRAELSKVTWPTRQEATKLTGIILAVSLVTGLYVGGLDYVFTNLLGLFLK